MEEQIESIVSREIPFAGIYSGSADDGRVLVIPIEIIRVFELRRNVDKSKLALWYRIHDNETPKYLELTDKLPSDDVELQHYFFITSRYSRCRASITKENRDRLEWEDIRKVFYYGARNYVEVYSEADFVQYVKPRLTAGIVRRTMSLLLHPRSH